MELLHSLIFARPKDPVKTNQKIPKSLLINILSEIMSGSIAVFLSEVLRKGRVGVFKKTSNEQSLMGPSDGWIKTGGGGGGACC